MSQRLQVLIIILLIPLGILFYLYDRQGFTFEKLLTPGTPVMHIGGVAFRVRIADTETLREQGLSGTDQSIWKTQNGLLFVFDTPDYYAFWMKDMNYPIDIIWIDDKLTVVGITRNLTPDSYPKKFRPPVAVRYAVETDIHYADTFGISVGNTVTLPIELKKNWP